MPEPGNAITPFGRRFSSSSLRRNGCGAPVRFPVRPAHHLMHAVALGPLRGDLFDTGTAAVNEHDVGVLRLRPVESRNHGAGIGDGLAAGDGDQCAGGQVRAGLAVLARAHEIAGVDGGGDQVSGPAGVRSAARAPDIAGVCAVGVGGGGAQDLERVAAVAEVPRPVGEQLELAGP